MVKQICQERSFICLETISAKKKHKKKKKKNNFDDLFNDLDNFNIKNDKKNKKSSKKKKKNKKKKQNKPKKNETFLDKLARVCHLDTKVNVKVTDESISCIGLALVGLIGKIILKKKA